MRPVSAVSLFSLAAGGAAVLSPGGRRLAHCASKKRDASPPQRADAAVEAALAAASPRCRRFVAWVLASGIEVVVFDMDRTMGSGHCGPGIKLGEEVEEYIAGVSADFVEAVRVLCQLPGLRLAVATASDPLEYGLPGQSRESHMLGPDLARALIGRWCLEALPRFEIMVGFDPELHPEEPRLPGKSLAMRRIAAHYDVEPQRMVLIDDSAHQLENTDGWHGVLVRGRDGFRFEDAFDEDPDAPLSPRLRRSLSCPPKLQKI